MARHLCALGPARASLCRDADTILDADGVEVEIMPGMVAQANILAGRKTVLDYILKPIVRIKDRALRD